MSAAMPRKRLSTYRKLSPSDIQLMKNFYWEGWNIGQLARHFGVSRQAIRFSLVRRGIQIRPRHPKGTNGSTGEGIRRQRDDAGVIVTVREQATGRIFSFHEPGPGALQAAAEKLDRAADEWRLVCYSSPQTIQTDLKGNRERRAKDHDSPYIEGPEAKALAQIGRLDLLDPSLQRTGDRNYRRREK